MIKKYICENLDVVMVQWKVKIYLKMIQIIVKLDETFNHILNMN